MKIKANNSEDVVMEDLTRLEAENKTRTIIKLKEKNERLLKKIQETNLKSHVTDVTNLDIMPMNVQTNERIKNDTTETAESAESQRVQNRRECKIRRECRRIAESAEITESAKIAENAEKPQGVQKIPKELINEQGVLKEERTKNK
ncbi:hypothetical protein Tco_1074785 [Tanacetum coccineum]